MHNDFFIRFVLNSEIFIGRRISENRVSISGMDNTEQQLNQRARQHFATLSKTGANKTGMHLRRERKGTFFLQLK